MVAPLETPYEPAPWDSLGPAKALLLGYVRTDVPGYRELSATPDFGIVTAGEYRFDNLLDQAVIDLPNCDWHLSSNGGVVGAGSVLEAPDRLAWVVGYGVEAGGTISDDTRAHFVAPAGIPLMGFAWTEIRTEAERQKIVDQHRRNQGYVFGGAMVVQCKLTMHRWALGALLTGWCLRGKVTVGGITAIGSSTLSAGEAAGAVTGYVLGIDSAKWLGPTEEVAEVLLSIAYTQE